MQTATPTSELPIPVDRVRPATYTNSLTSMSTTNDWVEQFRSHVAGMDFDVAQDGADAIVLAPSKRSGIEIAYTYDRTLQGADNARRERNKLFSDFGGVRYTYICTNEDSTSMREVSRMLVDGLLEHHATMLADALQSSLRQTGEIDVRSFHNAIAPASDGLTPQIVRCMERPKPKRYAQLAARDRSERFPDGVLYGKFVFHGIRISRSPTNSNGERCLYANVLFTPVWDWERAAVAAESRSGTSITSMTVRRIAIRASDARPGPASESSC